MKKLFMVLGLLALSFGAQAVEVLEVSSKKAEYNELLFKQPFVNALFSPASAQSGKTVILNGHKNFLFKIKSGWEEPVQLFVVMRDGTRKRFKLIPNPDIDGATWPNENVANIKLVKDPLISMNKDKQFFIDILKSLYESKPDENGMRMPPPGFTENPAQDIVYYGPVLAQEIKRFSNTIHRISVYHLTSDAPMAVAPADFYHEGVVLVELNDDFVTPDGIEVLVITKEKME